MAERTESAAEYEPEDTKPLAAAPWLDKLKDYDKEFSKWHDQCVNAAKLYSKDERSDAADREYSIFWANIEVLKPATYARPPVPVVAPRFKDGNALARHASETLERTLVVSFEQQDLNGAMIEVRDEFLMYGRGTAWNRLSEKHDGTPCVEQEWVPYKDFAHGKAKTWKRVPWVGKREWMTREKGAERFDEAMAKNGSGSFEDIPLRKQDENSVTPDKGDMAPVWEIWDKESRCVYWVAEDYKNVLDKQDAFLDLQNFFPCPKPAYGTLVPGKLRPVPEIRQYKDQIEEINEYTARIAALSESLRLKGFFPAGAGDISEAIEAAMKSLDNRALLIPISSVAAFGNGSFKDMVVWWPVGEAIELVRQLVDLRRVVIEDVYQITGISDIVRGQASEKGKVTATEQQLKSQWGSLRIQERQKTMSEFARDMTRIAGEIMAENFPPDLLKQMSQIQLPSMEEKQQAMQQAQMAQQQQKPVPQELQDLLEKPAFEDVVKFLQEDRTRGFVIEIETDSTIQPDEDAEKNRRIEFVTAVGGLFQQAAPIVMQAPMIGGFVAEVLKFAAAGFRAGRPLEASIEKLAQQLEGMAKQPQKEKPDPAVMEAQEKIKLLQAEQQGKDQERQTRMKLESDNAMFEREEAKRKLDGELDIKRQQTADKAKAQSEANKLKAQAAPKANGDGKASGAAPQVNVDTSNVAEAMDEIGALMANAMQVLAQSSAQLASAADTMARSASAPKRVVRNAQGQVEGVEPVGVGIQ
jgi:hypothetical protein